MPQQLYFDVLTAAIKTPEQALIRMWVHTGIEAESQTKPRGRCDEYDSHVCPSGTLINYLRCFKASWWLLPFLIPGDRLGWSGWAFVTDRTDMNTPKLLPHWEQRLLQTHTQELTYLFSIRCNGWRRCRGPYAIPPRLLPSDTADYCSRSHTQMLMWRYDAFHKYIILVHSENCVLRPIKHLHCVGLNVVVRQ